LRKLYGVMVLNFKTIFSDLVPLLWPIALPILSAVVFQKTVIKTIDSTDALVSYFSWFWIFIIIATFTYGVGLHLARLREYGLLKTYILISGNKLIFIFGTLAVQSILAFVSLMLFSITMLIVYDITYYWFLVIPIILLIISIPFGLATIFIASLPIKQNTLNTLVSIVLYPLFFLAANSNSGNITFLDMLNPFLSYHVLADNLYILIAKSNLDSLNLLPLTYLLGYLILGVLSAKKINLLSRVER
jgi:ABC-2 type transport system permease protein